jgi:hypothetical protein
MSQQPDPVQWPIGEVNRLQSLINQGGLTLGSVSAAIEFLRRIAGPRSQFVVAAERSLGLGLDDSAHAVVDISPQHQ